MTTTTTTTTTRGALPRVRGRSDGQEVHAHIHKYTYTHIHIHTKDEGRSRGDEESNAFVRRSPHLRVCVNGRVSVSGRFICVLCCGWGKGPLRRKSESTTDRTRNGDDDIGNGDDDDGDCIGMRRDSWGRRGALVEKTHVDTLRI